MGMHFPSPGVAAGARATMLTAEYQTIVIEWCGPVSLETISDWGPGGLYMFTGKLKGQQYDRIQYIGITEGRYQDRFYRHHKIDLITRDRKCWVGKVMHPHRLRREWLERAESILIYLVDPKLNSRKKVYLPRPTAIISHWFTQEGEPRYNRHGIFKKFPDVISWDGDHWREGNLRVWDTVR